ncbi:MAG: hypothetical protein ABEJ35_00285 [Halobacteriaceae archaeon]
MARRPLAAVAVALLVVLAGCGGVLGGDGGDGGGTTTAPTSNPGGSPGDGPLPPGVTNSGIANSTALTNAHEAGLSTDGFTASYEISVTLSSSQGTRTQALTQTIRATSGLTRFFVNSTTTQGSQTVSSEYWGNETLALVRNEIGGQTQYQTLPDSINRSSRFTLASSLGQLLQIADYSVTGRETVDGQTLVTLTADSVNSSLGSGQGGVINAENVSNVSSTAVITTDGIIQEFTLSFNATTANGEASYQISFEVTGQGGVSVSRPAWVGQALSNVTITDLQATLENRVIAISHNGGDPVPEGSLIILQLNGTVYQGQIQSSISPGQTVYLQLNRSAGTVTVVPAADQGTQISGTANLVIYTQDQQTLLSATLNASTSDSST